MNYLLDQANLREKIVCDSAGTAGYHIGKPPDERMAAAASQLGIKLRGQARQFKSDFKTFNLILAMDQENYQDILALDPGRQYRDKVRLMCRVLFQASLVKKFQIHTTAVQQFNHVIDLLLDACNGLLQYITIPPNDAS